MLRMASKAAYLSEDVGEYELMNWLLKHFDSDVQRGILLVQIKTLEEFESFLKKLDSGGVYQGRNFNRNNYNEQRNRISRNFRENKPTNVLNRNTDDARK